MNQALDWLYDNVYEIRCSPIVVWLLLFDVNCVGEKDNSYMKEMRKKMIIIIISHHHNN